MGRTPKLSYALWSTFAGVASLAACGGDDGAGRLADAPQAAPIATVAASLTAASECGIATPPAVELMVSNSGTADLVIQAAVASGGFAVTTALPLTIVPGARTPLSIVPPAAVIGTDLGGSTKAGTLTLTTNDATAAHTVALTTNILGANLAFTDAAGAPKPVALVGSSGACPEAQAVFLRNTGTAPIGVGAASASGFAFAGFSGGTLEPGGSAMQMVRARTDTECAIKEVIVYQVTGTVCSASTASLSASFNISGSTSCFCS